MVNINKTQRAFNKNHYSSGDGMITTVWGPNLWHYLHTISFNYPVRPTNNDKKYYKQLILNMQYTLPCKYCRDNLKKNLKIHPLTNSDLKNREAFSKYIYNLHEIINKMLKKKSGLSYCDVRERYENFRSRCITDTEIPKLKIKKTRSKSKKTKKEKGCTEPLYGKKSRCIINIVPQKQKGKTLKIDNRCLIKGGRGRIFS